MHAIYGVYSHSSSQPYLSRKQKWINYEVRGRMNSLSQTSSSYSTRMEPLLSLNPPLPSPPLPWGTHHIQAALWSAPQSDEHTSGDANNCHGNGLGSSFLDWLTGSCIYPVGEIVSYEPAIRSVVVPRIEPLPHLCIMNSLQWKCDDTYYYRSFYSGH